MRPSGEQNPAQASRRWLALTAMTLGLSVAALDQLILATASTAISAELGGLAQLPWVFAAYLLSSACTMPLWGRLGDIYGRRRIFQIAIGIFIAASLLAGFSSSMEYLVLARFLQGLGGGGLLTLPNAIVADLVPPRLRASYYALNTGAWAAAGLIGPLVGGLLVDGPGWRFIFYINVPIGLLAIALMALGHRVPHRSIPHAIDYTGAALLAASVSALLVLCSQVGSESLPFSLGVGLLVFSLATAAGFVQHERRIAEPLIPLPLVAIPTVRVYLGVSVLYGLVNFAVAIFIPILAITVAGTSAVEAGFRLMPVPVGLMLGSVIVGRLIAWGARYRFYPALGLGLNGIALLLFSTLLPDSPRALALLYALLAGLGAGCVNPVITYVLQHSVPPAQVGLVTSLPTFARVVAQSIGIAVLGVLLTRRLDLHLTRLAPDAPPGLDSESLQARAEDIRELGEPLASAVVEACRLALSEIFLVMALIVATALLVSLRAPRVQPADSAPP